jgi:hypothetical protein
MGYSRWDNTEYTSYASSTKYRTLSRAEVFSNSKIVDALNPRMFMLRESCDSEKNPNSTPVIMALDVTGSMGEYAERIAKESLPQLMSDLLEKKPIQDPHLMFMAIDDVHTRRAADSLQVSQFEADIRILEQLREIYLVSGGGGNDSESYDLPWYFAAKRTKIDSFDKHGKKGFLFTMGDECAPYQNLSEEDLTTVFGPGEYQEYTPAQLLKMAREKYNVFHIVIEQGSYASSYGSSVMETWRELLGNAVLPLANFEDLSLIVQATMRISNGETVQSIIDEQSNRAAKQALLHTFAAII